MPIVFRFGRFFARSMMATRVPMAGPSTDMSAKIPAAWLIPEIRGIFEAMVTVYIPIEIPASKRM